MSLQWESRQDLNMARFGADMTLSGSPFQGAAALTENKWRLGIVLALNVFSFSE